MKHGDHFGDWELMDENPLGQGGNSTVWRVRHGNIEGALKLLNRFDRYPRFVDEVRFQTDHYKGEGVLPLLASHLPTVPSKTDRPWLITPIAIPIRNYVESSQEVLAAVISACGQIAATLSKIHAIGAAHRDIKPENLFFFDNRPVIGDFGLVSYLGKDALTMPGERLGPIHYVAPELIGNYDESMDCRPGDVFSLAKTLWVLATGQRYPIPGQLLQSEPATQIVSYLKLSHT